MAIAHDDDSRVACAHPPYEGQVLEAGDQLAGIKERGTLHGLITQLCVYVAMLTPTFACGTYSFYNFSVIQSAD
jgi:hypothetical protein